MLILIEQPPLLAFPYTIRKMRLTEQKINEVPFLMIMRPAFFLFRLNSVLE
jgi:hypothetical protein